MNSKMNELFRCVGSIANPYVEGSRSSCEALKFSLEVRLFYLTSIEATPKPLSQHSNYRVLHCGLLLAVTDLKYNTSVSLSNSSSFGQ